MWRSRTFHDSPSAAHHRPVVALGVGSDQGVLLGVEVPPRGRPLVDQRHRRRSSAQQVDHLVLARLRHQRVVAQAYSCGSSPYGSKQRKRPPRGGERLGVRAR